MPRSFDLSANYQGSVTQVHSAFADEQYWLARLADSGADEATLDTLDLSADGAIVVATTQVLRADRMPGFVTQFHQGDLQIKREEKWSAVVADRSTASVAARIPGAPASVTGSGNLVPDGAGSKADLKVTVEVKIPLVGGKVEGFIGTQLVDLLISEQRFTTAWILDRQH
ncbi:hypothetical protein MCHIJ_03530 [Mycolicibacterium chitae]|uniref:Protein of uncharacterized function (DUF2505) n=1 Tax=Mycolicibacterium chitae TaxID=1792 RepID=A0A448IBE4_MYCCI|nr:DUF2505 domain-containing protein [Mycolicibacterium chitae]MCV7107236.1 DUF2505 domain-containing protein [Mycolicibacterium chitae]BBZ00916.1 hypothetical protein MCHIJ_03530 [Mycolicibacterium chitae]VEG49763.1 Protein of uncharacterised function (DUF2505) [Mycolicibacterium chitae]